MRTSKITIKLPQGQPNPSFSHIPPPTTPIRSIAAATIGRRSGPSRRAAYAPARFVDQSLSICGTCGTANCCQDDTDHRDDVFMAAFASIENRVG